MVQLITLISAIVMSASLWAQSPSERQHPRVMELQDKLTSYARDYLKTRLPEVPFLITLRIEPLRRAPNSGYQVENEKLPFFDLSEEEIRDEWDDPSASLYTLQTRIQKATLVVSLPQSLKDSEVDEVKEALTSLLRLVPGRDEVRVERRSWSLGDKFWNYVIVASALAVSFILGLWLVSTAWTRRLTKAILQIKPNATEKSEAPPTLNVPQAQTGADGKPLGNNALKFSDPLRTREFIMKRVQDLVQNPHFPNLEAMILMDKVAQQTPKALGALLLEFPKSKQEDIFSLSFKPQWLEAYSNPGEVGPEALELIDRLSRVHYEDSNSDWESLLVQVWRLGNEGPAFLKELDRAEAFAILRKLPSSISIPLARSAFPGGWGVLLDGTEKSKPLPTSRIQQLTETALKRVPRLKFEALHRYRQDRDLVEYLRQAVVVEEREVYEALPTGSYLWEVRPPFYKIFEAPEDMLKALVERVSLDDWALALFNTPREMRKAVENLLNEKQKYMVTSKMRTIDQAGLDRAVMGAVRERIGRLYFEMSKITKPLSAEKEEAPDENRQAA